MGFDERFKSCLAIVFYTCCDARHVHDLNLGFVRFDVRDHDTRACQTAVQRDDSECRHGAAEGGRRARGTMWIEWT